MEAGYICKKCGKPSPLGIGYASHDQGAYERSKNLTQCECGYSQKPEKDQGKRHANNEV